MKTTSLQDLARSGVLQSGLNTQKRNKPKHEHSPRMDTMIFGVCRKCGAVACYQRYCKDCGKAYCVKCAGQELPK